MSKETGMQTPPPSTLVALDEQEDRFLDGDLTGAYAETGAKRPLRLKSAASPRPADLTWLIAKRGGLEAVTEYVTYRAASLASDYAILEIDGTRVLQDFTSVEAACRAACADHILRTTKAALATTEGKDNG